jgi:peptidoglycan/xylan/chitin deacetylase (PgdA/CDA1 family)
MQRLISLNIPVLNLSNFLVDDPELPFAVAVCFNDGNESDYTIAKPILEELHLPASFFMVTNTLNKSGKLNTEHVSNLIQSGFHIGSHGLHHELLTRMDVLSQHKELSESKDFLEKKLQLVIDDFAFAYGQYDDSILTQARNCGYKRCYSTGMRLNDCNPMPYVLFRWNLTNKINMSHFEQVISSQGKLSPAFDLHSKLIYGQNTPKL